jgi:hypothetical protein
MCNESVLNVWTSNFEDIGYNLKIDGWLNNFTDVKNQSMRDDRLHWRGTREKHPEFFSYLFPLSRTRTTLSWIGNVALVRSSPPYFSCLCFLLILISFVFGQFPIHFLFVEAPSLPSSRTSPFNILVLDFQDIEAEQGKDSDRHGSPSFLLRLVRLEPPSHMYCFCLSLCKFIC